MRQKPIKDLLLDLLVLGRRFDDQISFGHVRQILAGHDPCNGLIPRVFCNLLAADLPIQITSDDVHRVFQGIFADVIQNNIIARKCHHVGDPVAHLSGADNTD